MGTLNDYKTIHQALHDSNSTHVQLDKKAFKIRTSKGFRYIVLNDDVFAQQNKSNKHMFRRRVKAERVTRIIRSGKKWGWISDNEIADPMLKESNDEPSTSD